MVISPLFSFSYYLFRTHITRKLNVKARAAGFEADLSSDAQLSANIAGLWRQLPWSKQLQFAQLALELQQMSTSIGITVVVRVFKFPFKLCML